MFTDWIMSDSDALDNVQLVTRDAHVIPILFCFIYRATDSSSEHEEGKLREVCLDIQCDVKERVTPADSGIGAE